MGEAWMPLLPVLIGLLGLQTVVGLALVLWWWPRQLRAALQQAAEAARDEAAAQPRPADQAAVRLLQWLDAEPRVRQLQQAQAERQQQALRSELNDAARGTRQELAATLAGLQQTLLTQSGDVARTQNEQIDAFRVQLGSLQQAVTLTLQQVSATLQQQAQAARDAQDAALRSQAQASGEALQRFGGQLHEALQQLGALLGQRLQGLTEGQERQLTGMRQTVEARLATLQQSNEARLEQMRLTVDEKLQATLQTRLGESFRQVAERLDQVHRGLGEMQTLARDVGSLNRVLTNVKTRGIFGEVQLAGLLEQVLTPEQYATNVETVPGTGARVEFAVRLPGRAPAGAADAPPVWLPIDAKFPREDYERLLEAQDRADPVAVEQSARAIEGRLRLEARSIRDKYLAAPHTTDFAILFVPTEGLYAEALRRPGLVEALQREHRVALAGPTTLLATLSSLQMGFRTLALERRSAEVWEVLGAVKTEFGKFGEVLARTRKKLQEAGNTIGQAETRTRQMQRRLRAVEALPEPQAQQLLGGLAATDGGLDATLAGADGDATDGDGAAACDGPDAAARPGAHGELGGG